MHAINDYVEASFDYGKVRGMVLFGKDWAFFIVAKNGHE